MDRPELVGGWASERDAKSASRSLADIRVVVAGDWAMVRTALAFYVASRSNITVLAECGLDEVLTMARRHHPDVFVLALPDETVLAHIPDMIDACPETSVLMLAASPQSLHERAPELGLRFVLALEQPAAMLVNAIERVRAGGGIPPDDARTASLLPSVRRSRPRRQPAEEQIASLTRRELEIVQLVGQGLRHHQIAERLFISSSTVRNHVTSILDKLDLTDSFDLAVYAFRHGIVRFS